MRKYTFTLPELKAFVNELISKMADGGISQTYYVIEDLSELQIERDEEKVVFTFNLKWCEITNNLGESNGFSETIQ